MGSKRSMLRNGLGEILEESVPRCSRFVDLFAGSASVSWHVAERFAIPVLAVDLQAYSAVLANGVIARDAAEGSSWIARWFARAEAVLKSDPNYGKAKALSENVGRKPVAALAEQARTLCAQAAGTTTRAYGGYYFSPAQSLVIDGLRGTLPRNPNHKSIALASLVSGASSCAASPGHTAQPFKPNDTAGKFLLEAWSKDVWTAVRSCALDLCMRHAMKIGRGCVGDANGVANTLREGDLVFVDPPYSAVHYSRFYHVLETITLGKDVEVSGQGRYPPDHLRPKSDYSIGSRSKLAMQDLLSKLAKRKCSVVVTFPAGQSSSGLSGSQILQDAKRLFRIEAETIHGRFSTLGGNQRQRSARAASEELVISLVPK